MRFAFFKFQNFKGIGTMHFDLTDNPSARVHTLVGLNESAKTTVLEAINYFLYKGESLEPLNLERYNIVDIHDLVPISKRDNFNGKVSIEAGIDLGKTVEAIKKAFQKEGARNVTVGSRITYTQNYHFVNSKHVPEKKENVWTHGFSGILGNDRTVKRDTIDARQFVYVSRTTPQHTGGFNVSSSFKGIRLYAGFDYAFGFVILNNQIVRGLSQVQGSQKSTTDVLKTWSPTNPNGHNAKILLG